MSDNFNNWDNEVTQVADVYGYDVPDPLTVRSEDDELLMHDNMNYQYTVDANPDKNKVKNILICGLIAVIVALLVVIAMFVLDGNDDDNSRKSDKNEKTSQSVLDKENRPTEDRADKEDVTEPGVAQEYKYNTEIFKNVNAPTEGDPVISLIEGYTEDKNQSFISLPYTVEKDGEKAYEILSIGKCTGEFNDGNHKYDLNESLAIVVKNTTDKFLSVSTVFFEYAEGKQCRFTVSNLEPDKSALVFAYTEAFDSVDYADVTKIDVSVEQAIMTAPYQSLTDKVGVDYKDGKFIITNLTPENFDQVSVKFMHCADNGANIYIGGNTGVIYQENVMPYETYIVDANSFDPKKSTIVAVETYKAE